MGNKIFFEEMGDRGKETPRVLNIISAKKRKRFVEILCGSTYSVPIGKYIVPGLCMSSAFIFSNLSLRFTAATNMSFIRSLSALIVPILALVFYKQKLKKAEHLSLLYAAIGCTIAGYMLQNTALQHISAKKIGIVQCLYPIATALIAFLVLNETLSLAGIVGALIITVCVIGENLLK